MLHAHMMNIIQPRTYNAEINKLLKAYNLPSVFLPDNPPSQETINTSQKSPTTMEKHSEPQPSISKQPQQEDPKEPEEETTDISEEEENTQTETLTLKPIKGKDIGLQIYAKQRKTGLNLKGLTTSMLKGEYKWAYTGYR